MIQDFVDRFFLNKDKIRASITYAFDSYEDIVRHLLPYLNSDYENYDNDRLTVINHGNYQGEELYIFTDDGYQPSDYYAFTGSCSGCDTLCHINKDLSYNHNLQCYNVPDKVKDQYITLMLHMIQRITKIN